jgi:hypothetical protein
MIGISIVRILTQVCSYVENSGGGLYDIDEAMEIEFQ